MESITLTHTLDAPPDDVREAITDVEPFMLASGFDEVSVHSDRLEISKALGLFKISLTLHILDDPGAVLAYEQVEGIFESMTTTYTIEEVGGGTKVTAETEFSLDAPGGSILDATLIKRQRRKELEGQFDYLDEQMT